VRVAILNQGGGLAGKLFYISKVRKVGIFEDFPDYFHKLAHPKSLDLKAGSLVEYSSLI